jgi:outer membrane protein assembly factor BamD (BamD/ComL family)
LGIYDEVVAAMPSHELAALSYYYKGCLLWKMKSYAEAVESYQTLIRRFPKHELVPEAYLYITKVYLDQSRREFQNSDLLAFAEVNLKKFKSEFPRDEHVEIAEREVARIKEVYACGLYDTAYFYERIGKPQASVIYYENAILQFPTTHVAQASRSRLSRLAPGALKQVEQQLQLRCEIEGKPEILETDEEIDFSGEDFSLEHI